MNEPDQNLPLPTMVSPDNLQEAFEKWFTWTGRPDSEKRSHYMAWQTAYYHGSYFATALYASPAPMIMCSACPRKEETLAIFNGHKAK